MILYTNCGLHFQCSVLCTLFRTGACKGRRGQPSAPPPTSPATTSINIGPPAMVPRPPHAVPAARPPPASPVKNVDPPDRNLTSKLASRLGSSPRPFPLQPVSLLTALGSGVHGFVLRVVRRTCNARRCISCRAVSVFFPARPPQRDC